MWVAANINQWHAEGESWFKIEKIPDDILLMAAYQAAGGANRRQSHASVHEALGFRSEENTKEKSRRGSRVSPND